MEHEPVAGPLDESNASVDLESMGIVPLPLINDQNILSIEGRDERLTLSSTPLPEIMKADNENVVDCSVNGIIIINGEKFYVGEGSADILGHVTTDLETGAIHSVQLEGHTNITDQSSGASVVQVITTNSQSAKPPEGKVPISRISKSVSSESVVSVTTPTIPPYVLSLDLSSANLLASPGLIRQNLRLQLQNEDGVSDAANLPVKLVMPSSVPEKTVIRECLWKDCGKTFEQLEALVNHVNDQHVKVSEREVDYVCRWFNCPRNGKGFNARYKMLIHIRTHTKEKPHNCPLCGKSFSRLENLKIHSRSHTGEKPYICPFVDCNKAYSNTSDRFKHVRTHQVDRPYLCKMPGCGKRYTDPSSLRKHVKTHGHFWRESYLKNGYDQLEMTCIGDAETDLSRSTDVSNSDNSPIFSSTNSNCVVSSVVFTTPMITTVPQSSFTPQIISVQGSTMEISDLSSNPLLTSTVLTNGASSQHDCTKEHLSDLRLKDLVSDGAVEVLENEKGQDTPLDLSTSPIASMEMIHTAGI
ncbi:zinc finger protein GLI4-like [Lineus longissimus]|uniref:zinc finger protein GLI4-like n=1 Tax=Lineus longissimus TaxID=88925 RepID=UPI002B4C4794